MKGSLRVLLVWMLAVPASHGAGTVPLDLSGEAVQGGLMIGRTAPDARVHVDDRPLRVSEDGLFLIGFGRDETGPVRLTVERGALREERVLRPASRDWRIQRVDGLPAGQVTPPADVLQRIERETRQVRVARSHDEARSDFAGGFIWPLEGRITGIFGSQRILNGTPRQPHYGVDVAAPTGTPVVAPADGLVTLAHTDMYYSGGTLVMDHGHGLSSTFIHLSRILVEDGQRVRQGQVVAEVGATGRATGPHLDWRMNLFEIRLDPQLAVGLEPPARPAGAPH
jgi:biotin carboxyl carrier protein